MSSSTAATASTPAEAKHYETAAKDRISMPHKLIYGLGGFVNNLLAAAIGSMIIVLPRTAKACQLVEMVD